MTKQSNNCPKMVLLVTVMMSWTPVPWDNGLFSMGFIHKGELSWALFSTCTATSDISESLSKCFHLNLQQQPFWPNAPGKQFPEHRTSTTLHKGHP